MTVDDTEREVMDHAPMPESMGFGIQESLDPVTPIDISLDSSMRPQLPAGLVVRSSQPPRHSHDIPLSSYPRLVSLDLVRLADAGNGMSFGTGLRGKKGRGDMSRAQHGRHRRREGKQVGVGDKGKQRAYEDAEVQESGGGKSRAQEVDWLRQQSMRALLETGSPRLARNMATYIREFFGELLEEEVSAIIEEVSHFLLKYSPETQTNAH